MHLKGENLPGEAEAGESLDSNHTHTCHILATQDSPAPTSQRQEPQEGLF